MIVNEINQDLQVHVDSLEFQQVGEQDFVYVAYGLVVQKLVIEIGW
jgi:hypothetical protein